MSTARLKLVPYSASDYAVSEPLYSKDATNLTSATDIGAMFSLYFQWPAHRSCIVICDPEKKRFFDCDLSYDTDESSPSELHVKVKNGLPAVTEFKNLDFHCEIFRTSYHFTSAVLAVSTTPEVDGWNFIISIPHNIYVRNARRLPRLDLTNFPGSASKPTCTVTSLQNTYTNVQILEMGASSLAIAGKLQTSEIVRIELNGATFHAKILNCNGEKTVLSLQFDSPHTYGDYFEFYRSYAYPILKGRYEIPYEVGLNLYAESGYFEKIPGGTTADQQSKVSDTWDRIKSGSHLTHLDYYGIDSEGNPSGVAGIALSHFIDKSSVWMMHQFCMTKKPEMLDITKDLHNWRSEYLAARSEDLSVGICFHSSSRWMERIYVKHSNLTKGNTTLYPAVMKWIEFTASNDKSESRTKLKTFPVGDCQRVATTTSHLWGAAGPTYFNANGTLDMIVSLDKSIPLTEIIDTGMALAANSDNDRLRALVVTPLETDLSSISGTPISADRVCHILKSDLGALITSVDHSIAVTKRKLANGAVN